MQIYCLIYKSRAHGLVSLELLSSISSKSQERNRALGVTGLLLTTDTHFFQVLEGSQEAVNQVFAGIVKDPRHTDVVIASYRIAAQRRFEKWAMRGVSMTGFDDDLGDSLKKKYGWENEGVRFPVEEFQAWAFVFDVIHLLSSD